MNKRFISANELLLDSFRLAEKIHASGFRPHFIVGIWRGGAPVGIAVQEYLQYRAVETDHIAIRTSSYYGIDRQHKDIKIHGLDYVIENVESDEDLLIVDDVFDSGRSIKAVIREIQLRARRNAPERISVACPWYKPERNVTDIEPDFYVHATDEWLVFPHELVGLTSDEIDAGKGSEIADLIRKSGPAKG
ncbi:hypoxanthine phosphoribosyltransferase [Proteobacteria bacterium 005FR1]|nr:hypoxanthine phosphoribosyltransferase [Proteobacteria bacterium 005FR1]